MKSFLFSALLAFSLSLSAQPMDPDSVAQAMRRLQEARNELRQAPYPSVSQLHRMIDLGLWGTARDQLGRLPTDSPEHQFLRARLLFLNNDFPQAEALVEGVLKAMPDHLEAALLKARLLVQAWRLAEAQQLCTQLLASHPRNAQVAFELGRVFVYQKSFDRALALARQAQNWDPGHAPSYLLEAEVYFWQRQPAKAEAPLRACLQRDPFLADARFNYGYAIWRRVDAQQLPAMADQWELALELHPLHYLTHWHWGNGHTHLTFKDYLDPQETEVRQALEPAESLIARNQLRQALDSIRAVAKRYPQSVIPSLYEGSAYYMAYDMDAPPRLKQAAHVFQDMLERKPHYGPAHNGLAAVIKAQRFPYLRMYDSLEQVIQNVQITEAERAPFTRVFPDMAYYPGDRVSKMVWNQLYTSKAYFPMLARMGREFVIPPLHVDLALAMESPYFRGGTTFDNRQWMDIRGVGSGATGIEYVERGAHLERNVTLHEYVHLFHSMVLTDAEMREVRKRYYHAMEHELVLDYYSANNEFEYFAQTYPAFFIPIKVHPLNHKSVNITRELKEKDPEMYAFIDQLVQKERRFLAGEEEVFSEKWAEVYVKLARQAAREDSLPLAMALLDTASQWQATYLPVLLQRATFLGEQGAFKQAFAWLEKAKEVDEGYAPLYVTYARLYAQQMQAGLGLRRELFQRQVASYEQAWQYETDFAIRADINAAFRRFYFRHARMAEAVATAEDYLEQAPTVSTYLRDQQDEARAFAQAIKGTLGYLEGAVAFFEDLIRRKPQRYHHRLQFADVLLANERYERALGVMAEARSLLKAAGNRYTAFSLRMAEAHARMGAVEEARSLLAEFEEVANLSDKEHLQLARVYAHLDQPEGGLGLLEEWEEPTEAVLRGEYHATLGALWEAQGKYEVAKKAWQSALDANPYQLEARLKACEYLQQTSPKKVRSLAQAAMALPLPPGPRWTQRFAPFQP